MSTVQSEWIVPLVSAGVGAIIGALITVVTEWAFTSIRDASASKKERKTRLRQWWNELKAIIHRFDLKWTQWSAEDHPNFDEPQGWVAELFEELLSLRSSIGPCQVRTEIDKATKELNRVSQLRMEYMGQAAVAYKDFVGTTTSVMEAIKKLADTVTDD